MLYAQLHPGSKTQYRTETGEVSRDVVEIAWTAQAREAAKAAAEAKEGA